MSLATPVAFCIFNRPDLTKRVFAAIKQQQPQHLLIISDGPRADRAEEEHQVAEARSIVDQVDWDCDLRLNFSDTNLGCRRRIGSGLTWAFEQFEELIILEDDCLPSESFFRFCESLLERYRHDRRVMMISGDQFDPQPAADYSYYFSKWAHIWGWASWRRAWNHFDEDMVSWPVAKQAGWLNASVEHDRELNHWANVFDQLHRGEIDTWDFPWMYSCWMQNGLTVLPNVNLISNIGFDERATHTIDSTSEVSEMATGQIGDIQHPPAVVRNRSADVRTLERIFLSDSEAAQRPPWLARRFNQLQRLIGRNRKNRVA